jgi:hypothetical protein
LAGKAERDPLFLGHIHCLNGVVVLKAQQIAGGAVLRYELTLDFGVGDFIMSCKRCSEIPVEVRQGGNISFPTAVKRMVELAATIRRLPQQLHESFQLVTIKSNEVLA